MTGFGRRVTVASISAAALALALAAPAGAAPAKLQMYEAVIAPALYQELSDEGYDLVAPEPARGGIAVDLVLSPSERTALERKGVELTEFRDPQGRSAQQRARAMARDGFTVWRDYDGDDGLRAYFDQFVAEHERIAKLVVIGQSLQGRDIVAIRIAKPRPKGKGRKAREQRKKMRDREAVLYQGTTHAREWISTEVTRRLMEFYASSDPRAKRMRKKRKLWFIPVVNPDGYQYTFEVERLWRKNLRDNDGDGQITNFDGVDLNRNYPEHWGYDNEGSEPEFSSQVYRGTAPGSEPEAAANIAFVQRIDPVFTLSYHSYGPLLLYPEGWQIQTPARDLPVYLALTGNDDKPAVEGFDPDVSAELYTTNGEFTDWAHGEENVLAWTPELEEGCEGCGFIFPDDEALVQRQFEINLPFAHDLARSADNPGDPKSHLGNTTEPFHLELVSRDPTYANNPLADFRFDRSYGDPQPVDVLARNRVRKVRLKYRINGGEKQKVRAPRWDGGENFGAGYDAYYDIRRGLVEGTNPGDSVEVWFTGKEKKRKPNGEPKLKCTDRKGDGTKRKKCKPKWERARSESFTYEAVSETGARALVVAAEDYTGISPVQTGGPSYLGFYTDALTANGISHDVYDVDAAGRKAPDALGVLSHYDAVVWYTGDDIITREEGMVAGTASRLANDEMLEMRAYLNEGGKLLYTGQFAGLQYAANAYLFDPVANAPCNPDDPSLTPTCQALSDDFLQYYLGAYLYNDDAGTDPATGSPYPVDGVAAPFEGLEWDLNGPDSADNQGHTASFLTTSSLLPESQFPQFASDAPAIWDRGPGPAPFEPFDGSKYMYSQRANESYKRLLRTVDLTGVTGADSPTLSFRASYDTEIFWDFLAVEVHRVGQDDWTTLPATDENGDPVTSDETGDSCPEGWHELHPFLTHYQTLNADGTCSPTGTSGDWNAATGRSPGWQEWNIDLSAYAGEEIEVSITYISDWGIQGLGTFVDDVHLTAGGSDLPGTTSFEDDTDPMDGWTVPGAPADSPGNANDWDRTGSVGFEEGAAVSTDDTLYFGFGFEGIATPGARNEVMGRSMSYLLGG